MHHSELRTTATRILDEAELLVQGRGFNGFSYADIAARLQVTKATLHYHFPSKAILGTRLVDRYRIRFHDARDRIDLLTDAPDAGLRAYIELFVKLVRSGRVCVCGMLAADHETLPEGVQQAVGDFFASNETWLAACLDQGRASGALDFAGPPLDMARHVIDALEGAMLLSRAHGDPARFEATASRLMQELRA